ncbi:helix-turn-helix domain-containing protein [Treponema phagedenis]|uniref:helix-turn-helix domain-containing protein n=1 Tax=Treponema phagedenis TaxID=162 RepID=UPI0001F638FC|nr:helix-turn-helix transcriptional regulator [Treponema phagedenis]EFW36538.1 hypothetical protein HMPREF9554_02988 [Treponema phagedenis F0421]TYT79737.1 helix-turn-helix transcriptional regulator [Treponema phagedenis]
MDAKKFWDNTNMLIKAQNTTQEAIANTCDMNFGTFKNRSSKKTPPNVIEAYKIAKALNVPMEFLVTGKNPPHWKPPARIAPIVEILETLSDQDLAVVLKMVSGLVKE